MLKNIAIGCAVLFFGFIGLILVGLFGLGYAIEKGYMPDATALAKGDINPRYISKLQEANIIDADEQVYYIYMGGFLSVLEDGNLFTDKRVISYESFDGQLDVYEATYPEIQSLDFEPGESWIDDSIITVNMKDGDWFILIVSADGGDKSFYNKLEETWKAKRGEDFDEAAPTPEAPAIEPTSEPSMRSTGS
ncbi:hypothetical protein [Cerasicoccus fimbriatus]|uniref:hypothetical protein n=1 Tax=Cerasicoccus fimbriatus TaxID=3014554 RepID=UPI0022B4AEFC|nr:hypothetical protein [Cerasicoccus sp. TK19100]